MNSSTFFRIGALWLVASLFGCTSSSPSSSSGDQCPSDALRCLNDTTMEVCAPANPDAASPGPLVWNQVPCRPGSCVTLANGLNGGAMCADLSAIDPRCGSDRDNSYCRAGDYIVRCSFGYQTGVEKCSGQCVEPNFGMATCLAAGAYQDPICTGADGFRCKGTSIVRCSLGYVVAQAACLTCDADAGTCSGYYGATCAQTADCASGFVCGSSGRCTIGCGGDAGSDAAADDAGAALNDECLAARSFEGLDSAGLVPGSTLPASCVGGYCQ